MEENKSWCDNLKTKTQEEIENVINQGLNIDNISYLGKLVDINKDVENIEYWKEKKKMYRDESYDTYGRRMIDSRGRFMGDTTYGRRGRRYRGHTLLDDMKETYGAYMENAEYGNYGGEENMELIEAMTDSLMGFVDHLKKNAKTPEERNFIEQKLHELGRM